MQGEAGYSAGCNERGRGCRMWGQGIVQGVMRGEGNQPVSEKKLPAKLPSETVDLEEEN